VRYTLKYVSRAILLCIVSLLALACTSEINDTADAELTAPAPSKVQLVKGRSAPIAVRLPKGTHSFLVQVSGDPQVRYRVRSIKNPSGDEVVPQNAEGRLLHTPSTKNPATAAPFPGTATALVPNAPDVHVIDGLWTIEVESDAVKIDTVRFAVVPQRAREKGTLSLKLHFTGARYGEEALTSATAKKRSDFQDELAAFRDRFRQVNIAVRFEYTDVSSVFQKPKATGPASLSTLFGLESASPDVLHVYFVEQIPPPAPGNAEGVASGLPGSMTGSGIVLSLNTSRLATTMAHEAGHFLGLYHTEELDGSYTDSLEDTPVGELGSANIMYPISQNGGARFSASQGQIMLGHPLVRSN
jgi:Pregnancy-associated plasma protein-A